MNDKIARTRLEGVPKTVRDDLAECREDLPAGAITAVGRFFRLLAERGEHSSAPSRATFEAACGNESALGLLLRVLGKHVPSVCLAEGRTLRKEYYSKRPGGTKHPSRSSGRRPSPGGPVGRSWPGAWLTLLPDLRAAPIKDSSINRHIASVNRCAAMVPSLRCPPRLGWLLAWELAQALQKGDAETGQTGVTARTAATYIAGLVSLGLHGGMDEDALNGMRAVQSHLQRQGRRVPKKKEARIEELYAKGGYEEVMRVLLSELEEADKLPDWTAEAETARATAAVLGVCMNDPARTGDVAMWTLGEELVREPVGRWRLRWRQGKTGAWKEAGDLWPEIGAVLDEHILGGRPQRHAQRRFEELRGCNWLSFAREPYASRWPSEKVNDAIGVPLHDLRTLAADYLRMHDPVAAPRIVAVLLGHRTQEAGEEYRALCAETAAQREWCKIRQKHAEARSR
jgi:soluble cytochrome b562